tara:strand:- start:43 stop:663 length:621 start_codon:yes stop_codon:yes gene_type:complete
MAIKRFRMRVKGHPYELSRYSGRRIKPGAFVEVTPVVQGFMGEFRGLKGVDLVRKVVKELSKFQVFELPKDEMEHVYLKRTASEILESKHIFVADDKLAKKYSVNGCTDYVLALMSCLRAAGYNPKFVRTLDHSVIRVKMHGADAKIRDYEIDPSVNPYKQNPSKPINAAKRREIANRKRRKTYAEGKTHQHIGMNGLEDFNRYVA